MTIHDWVPLYESEQKIANMNECEIWNRSIVRVGTGAHLQLPIVIALFLFNTMRGPTVLAFISLSDLHIAWLTVLEGKLALQCLESEDD